MANTVNVAHVQQFNANVEMILQQLDSRFRGKVNEKSDYVGKQATVVDQIGKVEMVQKTVRNGPVTFANVPHTRRWVMPTDYNLADAVDSTDKLRTLWDPTGYYAEEFRSAARRRIDATIYDAFFANAYTGENGTSTTSFPTSTQQIVSGSVGLTVAKLRTAREKLRAAEVPEDEPLFCGITAVDETALMNEIQIINLDYNTRPVLVEGKVTSFMGFNFVHYESVATASSERRLPVWAKSGMHLAIWKDVVVDVGIRRDLGTTMQVFAEMTIGATRTQELKVVEILCA